MAGRILITKDNFIEQLIKATEDLLNMAREMTWNKISDNCFYILFDKDKNDEKRFSVEKRSAKSKSDKGTPQRLIDVAPVFLDLYPSFYEVDLQIYKASKKETIIEIWYRLKNSSDPGYKTTVEDNAPMLHCKVQIPFYIDFDKRKKFDINWKNNSLSYKLNSFWAKSIYRLKTSIGLKYFRY